MKGKEILGVRVKERMGGENGGEGKDMSGKKGEKRSEGEKKGGQYNIIF